jgi:hypothetical protein
MGAVTYPDKRVAEFITARMVPIQVLSDHPLASEFNIRWTPTIIVLDYYGKEHQRTVGFMPPEEFIPSLMLGMGKIDFETGQYEAAIRHFDTVVSDYPGSFAAPEAIYLRGVSGYYRSHEAAPLKEAYERLKSGYPASEWVKRAEPYSLL